MKLLALSLFLLAYTPAADARKVDLKPKHEKAEDPGSATPLLYKTDKPVPAFGAKEGKTRITSTCTDSLGMIHKGGEASYETCIRNQNKLPPKANNEKSPNSVGITIGR